MKKSILLSVLGATIFAPSVMFAEEYPASASTQVYDFSPWANDAVLELFAKAADEGRAIPTAAEFEAIGLTVDLEFARSHTRRHGIYEDAAKNVVSTVHPTRRLWCNFPGGQGSGNGGYPSTGWNTDVFSMWNYTHIFGNWNHGILQAPGAWLDAAHRNGTRAYSGIKFFESWTAGSEAAGFAKFITTKNEDGSFRYVDALINASAFFGSDGINYNMEDNAYTNADWVAFHAALKKRAKERGLDGFGIGMYTQNQSLSTANVGQLLGGDKENGAVYDCFLNYSGGDFAYLGVTTSLTNAKNLVGNANDVYQGVWIVTWDRKWGQMNTTSRKEMNICLWGEHDQSRFWQYAVGRDPMNKQANYQGLLEKAFSGSNKNPLNRPALPSTQSGSNFQVANYTQEPTQMANFGGLASMLPERTAVGPELPFQTFFSLGNGEKYFYKGKATHGGWYNMSQQDLVPTYRWRVTAKNDMNTAANDIKVAFTGEDSYIGGSCLRLTGATTAGNDIVLYRTKLAAKGAVKATVALKGQAGATGLSLLVRKAGASEWIEVPCGDLSGTTWEAKTLNISGLGAGDEIEYVGLRVNSAAEGYKMNVGQILLTDDRTTKHASIKDGSLLVEVKEESTAGLSVKLNWSVDGTGFTTSQNNYGTIFNDEVNIDHFEVFVKDSADGRVREVARTSQWAAYIGKLALDQQAQAFVGVRSVSTDLKSYSPIQWVQIPRHTGALPAPEAEDAYGKCVLQNFGNHGEGTHIVEQIYWGDVTTEGAEKNLDYHVSSNPADAENYYYAKNHVLKIKQGSTIKLTFKGGKHPEYGTGTSTSKPAGTNASNNCCSMKWDLAYVYMDLDGNCNFLDADEEIGMCGNLNAGTDEILDPGITLTFNVPTDAKVGPSRLRVTSSDAWGAHPGPVGPNWKGSCLDFPVEIVGDNESRKAAVTYAGYQDKGEAEQPEGLGSSDIEDVVSAQTIPAYTVADGMISFENVDRAWIYDATGRTVKFVANGNLPVSISDLANGVYVIKMQTGQVIRGAKFSKN